MRWGTASRKSAVQSSSPLDQLYRSRIRARRNSRAANRADTCALVTLTGHGGCGKTRLAQQTSLELLNAYPDGVWLVELAPIGKAAHIPQAVAAALGLRKETGDTREQFMQQARARLGETAFGAAYQSGQSASAEQAIAVSEFYNLALRAQN